MEANPYEPPKAEVADVVVADTDFYVVSSKKFLILYLVTLGIYGRYWVYKNWKIHKDRTGADVWPIPRAIFPIFFMHSLGALVDQKLRLQGNRNGFEYGWPSLAFVIATVAGNICDRLSVKSIGEPVTDLAVFVLLPITCWALWTFQKVINAACGQPNGESNDKLTGANYVWIIFGLLFWVLLIIGLRETLAG